jgi:uncharacterized protein
MKTTLLFRLLFLVVAGVLGATIVQAEDLGAVRARMEKRVSATDALKERKVIGENNRGYLEARGDVAAPEAATISEENADRKVVYAAIAAQQKADVETVGRRRAQQIAANSTHGVWLQEPNGNWTQKP